MKYYIVQNEAQRQTTDFDIVKVKDLDRDKFLGGLKEGTIVIAEGNSLMEALIEFQKLIVT
ncbi:hypothetical protein QEG73_19665 [Chitinophagaceae bacterium 26-R-25]|nr:hypothetical protein [Chitinophagaceae bacterium 26-R-25]